MPPYFVAILVVPVFVPFKFLALRSVTVRRRTARIRRLFCAQPVTPVGWLFDFALAECGSDRLPVIVAYRLRGKVDKFQ